MTRMGQTLRANKSHNSTKMAKTKIKNHMHIFTYHKKHSSKFKINLTKEVRGDAGTRFQTDGWIEGPHTQT